MHFEIINTIYYFYYGCYGQQNISLLKNKLIVMKLINKILMCVATTAITLSASAQSADRES